MATHIKPLNISKNLEVSVDQTSRSLTLKITCNIDSTDPINNIKGRAHLTANNQEAELSDANEVYLIPEAYTFPANFNLPYKCDFTIGIDLIRFTELFTAKDANVYLTFVLSFQYHDLNIISLDDITSYDLKKLPVDLYQSKDISILSRPNISFKGKTSEAARKIKTEPLLKVYKDKITKSKGFGFLWKIPYTFDNLFGSTSKSPQYCTVPVFYGTDRKQKDISKPNEFYGCERGEFDYGICDVSIPNDHKSGEIERPKWWKLEFEEDADKHVTLLKITTLNKDDYFSKMKDKIESSDSEAFVFIHGFNVSFDEAARRTAQIAYDICFKGAPILYSWPSHGTTEGYLGDEDTIKWTVPHLVKFLKDILRITKAEKLHLIAHSMGNRALVDAIIEVVTWAKEKDIKSIFNQVILTAPDIDADIFKSQIAPKIINGAKRTTLYASSEDKALSLSRKIRGNNVPRAGESGERIVIAPGIDTIDASNVHTEFLGHSYFADSLPLITDIHYLTEYGDGPEKRKLQKCYKDKLEYWKFPPYK